jgi:hypothetical protein
MISGDASKNMTIHGKSIKDSGIIDDVLITWMVGVEAAHI